MNSTAEETQLVAYIKTIPEDHWRARCNTPDRTRYFLSIRNYYLLVAELLEDFFQRGVPKDFESKYQDKLLLKSAQKTAKEYRLIYPLIHDAWKYIKADLLMVVKEYMNNQTEGENIVFDWNRITPFHFTCSIFCEDANRMLEDCIFPELVTGNNYAEFGFAKTRHFVIGANKIIKNKTKLNPQHLEEFKASAIDPELIDLNVRSVDLSWSNKYRGGEEIENEDILFILESLNWTVTRLANGRINDNTLKKVKKMIGGWHILPFYGLADRAEINHFRFRPDNPTAQWSNGKVSTDKYIGAVGESPRAYCPNVTEAIWAVIAARYGVEKSGIDFWEWILDHPEIPVIITEGEKKAFSGLSGGYVVISLPGIDSGYKSSSDNDDGSGGKSSLIPDLKALAADGRTILIAFDRDSNPQTVKRVQRARKVLARLFGEFGCEVRSIKWDEQYKGLDDFFFGAGQESLDSAIENAQNITPKPRIEGDPKDKNPSALEMSKKVFKDLFDNIIRFDASVKQYWRYDGNGKWVVCSDEYIFGVVQEYLEEVIDTFSPNYVENVIRFGKKDILHEGWTEMSSLMYLPFENGVLEMTTKQLLPHSPDCRSQLGEY